MALRARELPDDGEDLLARYLRARSVRDAGAEPGETEGIRTCTHCGERARFRVDPMGTWGECSNCGHFA